MSHTESQTKANMPKTSILQTLRRAKLPVKIALVAVLVLTGWGAYKVFFAKSAGTGGGPRGVTVAVETAPINRGPIRELGLFSGTLIPKTSFTVAPKVSGKVRQLLVDIGDTVRQGQLVAVLEDEEYRQQSSRPKPTSAWPKPTWPKPKATWRWSSGTSTGPNRSTPKGSNRIPSWTRPSPSTKPRKPGQGRRSPGGQPDGRLGNIQAPPLVHPDSGVLGAGQLESATSASGS